MEDLISVTTVRKTMLMQELQVTHHHYYSSHFFDAGEGKENSTFGYLVKGNATLNSMSENISVSEGSLFYIPEGQVYHSIWTGSPDIEFYSVHIVWNQLNVESKDKLAMQPIPQLSTPETLETFLTLYSLLESEEYIDRIRAVGLFFQWYHKVLPLLKPRSNKSVSAVLLTAIDFIQQNYEREIDTAQVAAHCCISESRLYHLFQESMKITPGQYKNIYRVEKAAQLLCMTNMEIEQIANKVGFNSTIYFREIFKRITGSTPSKYRNTMREKIK